MPASHNFQVSTARRTPATGRPRTHTLEGRVVGTVDAATFTNAQTGAQAPIKGPIVKALKALSQNPDQPYEAVAAKAGFNADRKGKHGPALSRALKALSQKTAAAS